tara:strand:+ start:1367 stop:1576 length:210 start_codon:yes stop_codon:yes gene_type:complete
VNKIIDIDAMNTNDILNREVKNCTVRLHPDKHPNPNKNNICVLKIKNVKLETKIKRKNKMDLDRMKLKK